MRLWTPLGALPDFIAETGVGGCKRTSGSRCAARGNVLARRLAGLGVGLLSLFGASPCALRGDWCFRIIWGATGVDFAVRGEVFRGRFGENDTCLNASESLGRDGLPGSDVME